MDDRYLEFLRQRVGGRRYGRENVVNQPETIAISFCASRSLEMTSWLWNAFSGSVILSIRPCPEHLFTGSLKVIYAIFLPKRISNPTDDIFFTAILEYLLKIWRISGYRVSSGKVSQRGGHCTIGKFDLRWT